MKIRKIENRIDHLKEKRDELKRELNSIEERIDKYIKEHSLEEKIKGLNDEQIKLLVENLGWKTPEKIEKIEVIKSEAKKRGFWNECPECGYLFSTKRWLNLHRALEHGIWGRKNGDREENDN